MTSDFNEISMFSLFVFVVKDKLHTEDQTLLKTTTFVPKHFGVIAKLNLLLYIFWTLKQLCTYQTNVLHNIKDSAVVTNAIIKRVNCTYHKNALQSVSSAVPIHDSSSTCEMGWSYDPNLSIKNTQIINPYSPKHWNKF